MDNYDDNNKLYNKEAPNMDIKNDKIILNIIENLPIKKNKVSNNNDKRRAKKGKIVNQKIVIYLMNEIVVLKR